MNFPSLLFFSFLFFISASLLSSEQNHDSWENVLSLLTQPSPLKTAEKKKILTYTDQKPEMVKKITIKTIEKISSDALFCFSLAAWRKLSYKQINAIPDELFEKETVIKGKPLVNHLYKIFQFLPRQSSYLSASKIALLLTNKQEREECSSHYDWLKKRVVANCKEHFLYVLRDKIETPEVLQEKISYLKKLGNDSLFANLTPHDIGSINTLVIPYFLLAQVQLIKAAIFLFLSLEKLNAFNQHFKGLTNAQLDDLAVYYLDSLSSPNILQEDAHNEKRKESERWNFLLDALPDRQLERFNNSLGYLIGTYNKKSKKLPDSILLNFLLIHHYRYAPSQLESLSDYCLHVLIKYYRKYMKNKKGGRYYNEETGIKIKARHWKKFAKKALKNFKQLNLIEDNEFFSFHPKIIKLTNGTNTDVYLISSFTDEDMNYIPIEIMESLIKNGFAAFFTSHQLRALSSFYLTSLLVSYYTRAKKEKWWSDKEIREKNNWELFIARIYSEKNTSLYNIISPLKREEINVLLEETIDGILALVEEKYFPDEQIQGFPLPLLARFFKKSVNTPAKEIESQEHKKWKAFIRKLSPPQKTAWGIWEKTKELNMKRLK